MRKLIILFLVCSIAYFIIGWYGQHEAWLSMDQYLTYGGIVGGFASIIGLFGFLRPPMSRNDIQNIEIESLKKVVEASEEIKRLEKTQNKQLTEIDALEKQRIEMEFLVRKASMSLFLQEQKKYYLKEVRLHIDSSDDLQEKLKSLTEIDQKLHALDEEIEKDPNVEQLKRVIREATFSSISDYSVKDFKSPFTKAVFILLKSIDELTSSIYR